MEIPLHRAESATTCSIRSRSSAIDELRRTSSARTTRCSTRSSLRAVRALGVERAVVPASFPRAHRRPAARRGHRARRPTASSSPSRRRVKSAAELAGIRRAQAAAEAGMAAARELLRRPSPGDDGGARRRRAAAHVASASRPRSRRVPRARRDRRTLRRLARRRRRRSATTSARARSARGETVVIDLWPRDNRSACYADMTRTFVVGEVPAEVAEWHRLCLEALERARRRRPARA